LHCDKNSDWPSPGGFHDPSITVHIGHAVKGSPGDRILLPCNVADLFDGQAVRVGSEQCTQLVMIGFSHGCSFLSFRACSIRDSHCSTLHCMFFYNKNFDKPANLVGLLNAQAPILVIHFKDIGQAIKSRLHARKAVVQVKRSARWRVKREAQV
jgi:hypothetical protein